jgi:membrane-bound inhibitor of C-type lysozyme
MKSKSCWISILPLLIFGLTACSGGGSTNEASKADTVAAATVKPVAVYVSSDGKYSFDVLSKTKEDMKVKDESTGKVYQLSLSPSSTGTKYSSDDDYFFWIKGEDFMWGKGDSLLTSNKIKK